MPRIGRMQNYPRVLHSIEYSAHGVAKAVLAGRLLAEIYYSTSNTSSSAADNTPPLVASLNTSSSMSSPSPVSPSTWEYVMSKELTYLRSLPPPPSMLQEPVRWITNSLMKYRGARAVATGGEYKPLNMRIIIRDSMIIYYGLIVVFIIFVLLLGRGIWSLL
jgi:hypothetical protein